MRGRGGGWRRGKETGAGREGEEKGERVGESGGEERREGRTRESDDVVRRGMSVLVLVCPK